MSELSDAINEMRNMRESYDQIGAAAEAYNTGKTELAANITAKGVQASATETLPELADKVAAISQETYEINGGEMYAKQLFGSLDTPNYWNLYDILAQLLSDGRLVSYGGILLAEYYRGYDSLALSGAGAGGAYVVSDKDGNGDFIMYTEDIVHTWDTNDDGKGNRWVAYCFANEGHEFEITNATTSPRSIFIGRKVGAIKCLVNSRVSQIVVFDGSELTAFKANSYSQQWGKKVVIRNVTGQTGTIISDSTGIVENIYLDLAIAEGDYADKFVKTTNLSSIIANFNNTDLKTSNNIPLLSQSNKPAYVYLTGIKTFNAYVPALGVGAMFLHIDCQNLRNSLDKCICASVGYFELNVESAVSLGGYTFAYLVTNEFHLGYITNDYTKSVSFNQYQCTVGKIELMDGWLKPLDMSAFGGFSAEKIALYILDKLGTCTAQTGSLTLKIGSGNLSTITNDPDYSSYLTDAIDNKNWNVIA